MGRVSSQESGEGRHNSVHSRRGGDESENHRQQVQISPRKFSKKWVSNVVWTWGLEGIPFHGASIPACLYAGGNGPVERKPDGAVAGRILLLEREDGVHCRGRKAGHEGTEASPLVDAGSTRKPTLGIRGERMTRRVTRCL